MEGLVSRVTGTTCSGDALSSLHQWLTLGDVANTMKKGEEAPQGATRVADEVAHVPSGDDGEKVYGRLGPKCTALHRGNSFGVFDADSLRLRVTSRSHFATVRANTCVFAGKWQFECCVLTAGVVQIGWSQLGCRFSHEMGIGDLPGSYAYDGQRCKKWAVSNKDYGLQWSKGDVITCTLDCDAGVIAFYRNGVSMGDAFTDVVTGANIAYFPGASISEAETVRFNFGSTPLSYPVEGFAPLIEPPVALASRCNAVLSALDGVFLLAESGSVPVDDYAAAAARLWLSLVKSLDVYCVGACLAPWMRSHLTGNSHRTRLFVDSMVSSCLPSETAWIVARLSEWVGSRCVSHDFQAASPPLELLTGLLELSPTLVDAFVAQPRFDTVIEELLATKSPSDPDLIALLPSFSPFWKTRPSLLKTEAGDAATRSDVEVMHNSLRLHESRVYRLCSLVVNRAPFIHWSERYAHAAAGTRKSTGAQINLFFFILHHLDISGIYHRFPHLRVSYMVELPLERHDMGRLGGLLSHLQKEYPLPDEVTVPMEGVEHCYHQLMMVCITLFHNMINSRFRMSVETFKRFHAMNKEASASSNIPSARLDAARVVGRVAVWNALVLSAPHKQRSLCAAMSHMASSVDALATEMPNAFGYLPHAALEFILDSFRSLIFSKLPRFEMGQFSEALQRFVTFLVGHLNDPRIANPEIRDLLLQHLNAYLNTRVFSAAAEGNSLASASLVPTLLADSNRNWVIVSNILVRFHRGMGYNQSKIPDVKPPPTANHHTGRFYDPLDSDYWRPYKAGSALPSSVFCESMAFVCVQEGGAVIAPFLNNLFNTLNWCISEFSVGMDEYKLSSADRRKDTTPVQKKCMIMFELAGSLMRVLEIVTIHGARVLFSGSAHRVNMQRALEACLSILERTILFPDRKLFSQMLKRNGLSALLPDTHVLFPTFGVLLCLWLADPASMVETAIAQAALTTAIMECIRSSSQGLEDMLAQVEQARTERQAEEKSGLKRIASTELCTICYAGALDTRFVPCNHTSCADCIKRHLLNSKRCFFCNSDIERVESITGNGEK